MQFPSKPARGGLKTPSTLDPTLRRSFQISLLLVSLGALLLGIGMLLVLIQSRAGAGVGGLGLSGHAFDWWSHTQSGRAMFYISLLITFCLVGVIAVLCMALNFADRRLRYRTQDLNAALGSIGDLQDSLYGIQTALQDTSGGVHKRIDEIREVAEAILQHQPDLYERVPGLLFWLRAEDEFLCAVRDQAFPPGTDHYHDELREIFTFSPRKADIFQAIERVTRLEPLSPSN